MSELGQDARALVTAADGGDDPSFDDEARVRRKLHARLKVAAAVGAGASAAAATKSAAALTSVAAGLGGGAATGGTTVTAGVSLTTKLLLAAAISATAAGVTVVAVRQEASPASSPAGTSGTPRVASLRATPSLSSASANHASIESQAPVSPEVSAPPTPAARAPIPTQSESMPVTARADRTVDEASTTPFPRKATTRAAGPDRHVQNASISPPASAKPATVSSVPSQVPAPPAGPDSLSREAALLRDAQLALLAGDPTGALARLENHAVQFPTGALVEERRAARVLALCSQGRVTEAREAAQAFEREHPRSALTSSVRGACAGKR